MKRTEHGNRSYTNTDYPFPFFVLSKMAYLNKDSISIDISGVDHPSRKLRFEVFHNLLNEVTRISVVVSLFPSVGWWEQEVWDMSGVSSMNHPDLWCISTNYGFEVLYDDREKRAVSEPIKMTQLFRYFDFASPWEQRSNG
ncbi:hypothetical protein ZWY2020_003534 [Hordeum vulgare]|nr:hypothetical protein ZWY2020_003534 [Hordeum vulgare]